MRRTAPRWLDGLVTGLAVAALLTVPCVALGHGASDCGGAQFVVGAAIALVSLPLAMGTSRPPGGLLALIDARRRAPAAPPPGPPPARPSGWWDRTLSLDNVWLIAGATMILVSFLPPFIQV
jgi:hypothetical protein